MDGRRSNGHNSEMSVWSWTIQRTDKNYDHKIWYLALNLLLNYKKTVCEDFVLVDAAVAPVGTNGREKIWRKSQPAHDFSLFFLSSLLKFDFESSYKKQQILGKHKRFRNNFHT